jgi:hypothetical protein
MTLPTLQESTPGLSFRRTAERHYPESETHRCENLTSWVSAHVGLSAFYHVVYLFKRHIAYNYYNVREAGREQTG